MPQNTFAFAHRGKPRPIARTETAAEQMHGYWGGKGAPSATNP
jgi:hypothetical protein